MAVNVQDAGVLCQGSEITVEHLEQLLRNLPGGYKISVNQAHIEEEGENGFSGFAGMISCFNVNASTTEWIIDSGASDHIAI